MDPEIPEPRRRISFDGLLAAIVIGALVFATGLTLRPFLPAILWGVVLAVTAAPLHARILALMPRWPRSAAWITCLLMILIILVPAIGMTRAVIVYTPVILAWVEQLSSAPLTQAPPAIENLPLVGPMLGSNWEFVYQHVSAYVAHFKSDIEEWLLWALQEMETVGLFMFEFGVAIILAGVFLADEQRLAAFAHTFFARIGGAFAVRILDRSVLTTRSTVRGVVGSAVAEAVVAMFAYFIAGVPAWLVLGGLTFFAALIQIGAPLVWIPVAIWLVAQNQLGWAIFMVVWGMVVVYGVENLSRPFLTSRAAHLPGLLIFIGALGGLVAWGLIGVFLGPVILALAYELVLTWFRGEEGEVPAEPAQPPPPQSRRRKRAGTS